MSYWFDVRTCTENMTQTRSKLYFLLPVLRVITCRNWLCSKSHFAIKNKWCSSSPTHSPTNLQLQHSILVSCPLSSVSISKVSGIVCAVCAIRHLYFTSILWCNATPDRGSFDPKGDNLIFLLILILTSSPSLPLSTFYHSCFCFHFWVHCFCRQARFYEKLWQFLFWFATTLCAPTAACTSPSGFILAFRMNGRRW